MLDIQILVDRENDEEFDGDDPDYYFIHNISFTQNFIEL